MCLSCRGKDLQSSFSLSYRYNYGTDKRARQALFDLTQSIHGLDFSRWEKAGYWDSAFVPFSFFCGDTIVANTCIYLLPMRVAGVDVQVPQISTVATRPEYRRQGLNRELTRLALEWCSRQQTSDFQFFFADKDAFPFYGKCGFKPSSCARFRMVCPTVNGVSATVSGARRLDPDDRRDLDLLEELGRKRKPVSDALGMYYSHLLMFHALYTQRENMWFLPALRSVVMACRKGDTLHIHDIIATELPELQEVLSMLPMALGATQLEFAFAPDLFAPGCPGVPDSSEHGLHLGGHWPQSLSLLRFPSTAQA